MFGSYHPMTPIFFMAGAIMLKNRAQQQTSLTRIIEEGLQLRLRAVQPVNKPTARSIPVLNGGGGLVAGLDSTSNKALLDAAADDA